MLMDHTSRTSEKFRIFPIFAAILNFSGNEKCHHLNNCNTVVGQMFVPLDDKDYSFNLVNRIFLNFDHRLEKRYLSSKPW